MRTAKTRRITTRHAAIFAASILVAPGCAGEGFHDSVIADNLAGVQSVASPIQVHDKTHDRDARPAPNDASHRRVMPIVSTNWLHANMAADNLLILDVRPSADYAAAHIPGAVSEPFAVPVSAWIVQNDDLLLEMPEDEQLFQVIGRLGITRDTRVVVVTAPNAGEPPSYGRSSATRVALTLIYAGVRQVGVLDGGFPRWLSDGFPTTTAAPTVTPASYAGQVDTSIFVPRAYVERRLHEAPIVDNRDADVYFGTTTEVFADQAGHIASASSLPTPWIWDSDGLYRERSVLARMASGVIRRHPSNEVIVYCGVGGYSSAWWFVLSQVLGYDHVKFYDGAAQEWVRYHELIPYRWD